MDPVYLDHAASTPLRPEAREAMLAHLGLAHLGPAHLGPAHGRERFGNPSGSHQVARAARAAVEDARETVAACLGADPAEVVFTGGGTEADNLAVLGAAGGGRVLASAVEHEAVIGCVHALGGGLVPVDAHGVVDLEALEEALTPYVTVVSVMLANNEVGTVQPVAQVADLVHRLQPGAVVHTDAVQAYPWLDVAVLAAGADLVAVSGHKFGGPQGVGALVVRGRARLRPVIHGGGQEAGRRSGTHNVAGIVGLAAAMAAAARDRAGVVERVGRLRDRLADGLLGAVPGLRETVPRPLRVAGNCHVLIPGVESEALLFLLDQAGVCASAGSACASGALEPSHVLVAMGVGADEAAGALRLSLGWSTTPADVDAALAAVPAAVERLRTTRPAPAGA